MTDEPPSTFSQEPRVEVAALQKSVVTALFDEFFESGLEESISPFLTPESRKWGKNLHLKASFIATFFLIAAFVLSFYPAYSSLANLFLVVTYFFAGIQALISSIEDILNWEINIDVLMTLAAFLSIIIGSGFEGALLLVLFSLSGSMENAVTSRAKGAISSLKKLSPTKACVIQPDGSTYEKSIKDIDPGTLILVKTGEVIPLDCKVITGTSSVNLVHLTGENMPVTKKPGDEISAGGLNVEASLIVQVIHTSSDSTLARIIQLITRAQEAKPKLQRWLDAMSNTYAKTIILLSIGFALLLPFLTSIPFLGTEGSIYRSLAFLIAASPCALIIAIPIAYLSAVSSCARQGILLKGGTVLDSLSYCKIVAFDKTGTLTKGELSVAGIEFLSGNNSSKMKEEALRVAYSLEIHAVHPIALAVVNYAKKQGLTPLPLKNVQLIPGYGLEGFLNKENSEEITRCYLGQPQHIIDKVPLHLREELLSKISFFEEKGEVLSLLLFADSVILFRFSDILRPHIKSTLQSLKKLNLRLLMLTGDHTSSAEAIAKEAGITEFHAQLKPEDKLKIIEKISQKKHLAMIGDGINDAPALARATVGISMGKEGSATAINASDIVLLQDNIELLEWLFKKAKKTKFIVRENLFLALIAIVIATIPALLGWVPLWLAVILHEGGTVLVGLNALRLLRR